MEQLELPQDGIDLINRLDALTNGELLAMVNVTYRTVFQLLERDIPDMAVVAMTPVNNIGRIFEHLHAGMMAEETAVILINEIITEELRHWQLMFGADKAPTMVAFEQIPVEELMQTANSFTLDQLAGMVSQIGRENSTVH